MALESQSVAVRTAAAAMTLTVSMVAGIAGFEGFRDTAYIPVPGDVPTIGYGSTKGVQMGDTITQERALHRLRDEVDSVFAQGVRRCVLVPLTDYEFGAYVSLAYNIGVPTFCRKAKKGKPPNLIDLINSKQYKAACRRIEAFVYGPDGRGGKKIIRGLQNRRKEERRICEGKALRDRPVQLSLVQPSAGGVELAWYHNEIGSRESGYWRNLRAEIRADERCAGYLEISERGYRIEDGGLNNRQLMVLKDALSALDFKEMA